MQTSNPESPVWTADSLIARLTEAQQDGTLAKMSNEWLNIDLDLDKVTQTLSTLETGIERVDYIAFTCPPLYVKIC